MGRPRWISDRDLDPAYLLGPFDADRMIRLEGIHSAQAIGRAVVDLQRRFPTFLRNLQYVTTGARAYYHGQFLFGAIAQVVDAHSSINDDERLSARGTVRRHSVAVSPS